MDIVLKVLTGLVIALFLFMGLSAWIDPNQAGGNIGLEAMSIAGLNSIRGDVAGLFLASAAMLILGLWRGNTVWYLAVALLMGLIAIGRVIGFVTDGAEQQSLVAFGVEIFLVLLFVFMHRRATAV